MANASRKPGSIKGRRRSPKSCSLTAPDMSSTLIPATCSISLPIPVARMAPCCSLDYVSLRPSVAHDEMLGEARSVDLESDAPRRPIREPLQGGCHRPDAGRVRMHGLGLQHQLRVRQHVVLEHIILPNHGSRRYGPEVLVVVERVVGKDNHLIRL